MSRAASPLIFCAIDTSNKERALSLAQDLSAAGGALKLGLEYFCAHGPEGIREIQKNCPQTPLFLDLKLHDIPNTVAATIRTLAPLHPDFLTLHAAGGTEMMQAAHMAAEEMQKSSLPRTRLLAVTVLTSAAGEDTEKTVLDLARLAQDSGMDGIVCSGHEAAAVRAAYGADFILMVPGIRPADYTQTDDQKRTMTPQAALEAGATHLVIGRPVTESKDPAQALRGILKDIKSHN